jgi:alpha-L-fucosidase
MKSYSITAEVALALCVAPVMAVEKPGAEWGAAVADPAAAGLARPSKVQYNWQEQERAMFIQLDPATIQQGEYDNGTTPMKDIRFEKLDVNEWCKAAKAWGAKEIVFMLAHSGGFCMWPSKTTGYHIGNTAYKGGGGDVVKEFAAACRQHQLNAGFYFWMPRPASAGKPANTVAYDAALDKVTTMDQAKAVFATRFHEIMDRLGPDLVTEIWIDQPITASIGKEIVARAPKAVVQAVGCHDPHPTIRWPGNENGIVADPCWSTLKRSSIEKRAANQYEADANQTQAADDPDGDYWAPHQADVPLHDKFWHMRPDALNHRRSVAQLMDCYEKSVGRNSFLILNCAPQADGGIHPDDMKRYQEFGAEIDRRFGHPLAAIKPVPGHELLRDLGGLKEIGYTDLWEDYRFGHRIREYVIEGFNGKEWIPISRGTAVGRRKIDHCPSTPIVQVRVRITKSVGEPLIRKFQVHSGAPN